MSWYQWDPGRSTNRFSLIAYGGELLPVASAHLEPAEWFTTDGPNALILPMLAPHRLIKIQGGWEDFPNHALANR